ncbi:MAG: HD domain-containing protein [Gammaproteobacteria bacterium]|nr:HD domain-containing protein [Gammaproteobacteria bacterium]
MKAKFSPLSKLAVKADQPLLFPVFNKQGTLLAEKGTTLTAEQVDKITNLEEIYTYDRAMMSALVKNTGSSDESDAAFKLPPPFKRLSALEKILQEVFDKPSDPINKSKVLTIINRLQTICQKSPDASIAKIITDDNTNYAIKHVIHTAILCELSGQYLKWEPEERRNIIGAALTMNLSLGYLQNKLLDQAQPLTLEQKQIIHDHPKDSVAILKKMGVSNTAWLEIVEKHHENPEGTGYPSGLGHKELPIGASLVSLSDVYCAKVTGRNYKKPIFADVAVRDIYLEKDPAHEGTLIEVFVKLLGIYPPGCMVKLKSNEIGIVIKRGERVDTPVVQILNDAKNESLMFKVKRQTDKKNYAITSIINTKSELNKINYDDIWSI